MSGHGFTIFDTAVGRCGIAWGDLGIVGVQLPEARELETRRRMYRLYPEALTLLADDKVKLQNGLAVFV